LREGAGLPHLPAADRVGPEVDLVAILLGRISTHELYEAGVSLVRMTIKKRE